MGTRELVTLLRDKGVLVDGVPVAVACFVLWLTLTVALTEILYRALERPLTDAGRAWGDRFVAARSARQAPRPGPAPTVS